MGALVLIVGALMVAAGGYEMFAGSSDILSERGWSAFIAGAVLLAGGVVTAALGLSVRVIESLRGDLLRLAAGAMARPFADRAEPSSDFALDTAGHEPVSDPSFEQAQTVPVPAQAPAALFASQAAPIETAPVPEMRQQLEPSAEVAPTAEGGPAHDDWLDHSFADLEREMAAPPSAADLVRSAPAHAEPVEEAPALHSAGSPAEPTPEHIPEASALVFEEPSTPPPALEPVAQASKPVVHEPAPGGAIVSARENSQTPTSAVIGRYESEGTSYVMYADGSIDAQSEAGVYRFASMSELKAYIES